MNAAQRAYLKADLVKRFELQSPNQKLVDRLDKFFEMDIDLFSETIVIFDETDNDQIVEMFDSFYELN